MISQIKNSPSQSQARNCHDKFLCLLPSIRRQARFAFRTARHEQKEELVAEVVANSFSAFARLAERGKQDLAYAGPLALYAIRQVRAGRRVGGSRGTRDILSPRVIAREGLIRVPMYERDQETGAWREFLIEDRTAGPADTAAARIDFAAWFRSLVRRQRRIARTLAHGETTSTVARMFGVSAARVSQVRSELADSWAAFQGEALVV